ncbi:LuxR C-terminal-related transcriptional regulator, partial [Leucobacter soli]|uniref:LuxR C-terminal-related transcriptional regulator n=1 Tax=Leucobacter soli TaxID=2812850 RepID=UPI003608815E
FGWHDALLAKVGPDAQVLRAAAGAMRTRSVTEIIELLHALANEADADVPATIRPLLDRVDELADGGSGELRRAWAALAAFDTPFTLALATQVLSAHGLAHPEAVLAELVTRGVVRRTDDTPARFVVRVLYRLPDRIASRRTRPELLEQTRRGILNWWTARCADFTRLWFGPREIEEFDEIERDLPTLEMLVDTAGAATSRADGADLMRVVCALWPLFTARNRVKQALAWIDAIAEHAELDRATEFDKNWTIAWLALGGNDISGSEEALGSVQASDAVEEARLAQVRGIRELYADNAAESIRLLALACEGHRRAGDTAAQQFIAESHLAAAYWRAGEVERAAEMCTSALAISDASGEVWLRTFALWAAGLVAWSRGDRAAARRYAMEGVRAAIDHGDKHVASLCLELLVWQQAQEGEVERAARLRGVVRSLERVYDVPVHFWGTSALGDEASTLLAERLGSAELAELVRQGELQGIVDAVEWMDASTSAKRPQEASSPHGLTDRQLQVAGLIAEGRTNKEIAARLMVSVRAVEAHVERIFTRLGYSSRAQIAAWVARRGLAE